MSRSRPAAWTAVATASWLGLLGCVWYLYPKCNDEIHNGSETDVDCGGACGPCAVGRACRTGGDCGNGYCAGGVCAPLPCVNGVRDGAETDVDCGGGTCRKCAGGRHCQSDGDCFSGRCDPGSGACFSLQTVSFAEAVSYPAGSKSYALFAGDLDGNGQIDLAAANEQGNSISIFLGRGDGTFQHLGDFATGEYPTGGAIADLNRDGIADIVTADYHGNSVSVLLGVGDGTFLSAYHYPTRPGAETSNLAVGDLDGDGNLDVVATNPLAGSASIFRGRPDGTLAPAVDTPVRQGASAPFSAAIADFDGDGKNDLAIADMRGLAIVVRLGNGDGTFGPEVAYRDGGTPAYILIAGDVDLDGKVDLICANRGSSDVSVLLGRGDGTFADPILSSTGAGTGPYSIAIADFNLDGVPDLVTANYLSSTASVLLGIGGGTFEAPIDAGGTGASSYGVVTGDFDGDGKADLATCNAVSSDVTVKLNTSR